MKKKQNEKILPVEHGKSRSKQEPGHFQILSLDGGGIRSLFSAAVLAHLEKDFEIRITDYFDLIVGTSTGGIIALALGIGMAPREVVHFYVNKGPDIFAGRRPSTLRRAWHWSRHWFRNKFKANPLEECPQRMLW